MLSSLLRPGHLPQQLAEMEMTVGSQGTHAQLVGQGQGFAVIGLCRFGIARIATRGDFAEQTETPRLLTALLLALGQA